VQIVNKEDYTDLFQNFINGLYLLGKEYDNFIKTQKAEDKPLISDSSQ
jgi:hypothetical protein